MQNGLEILIKFSFTDLSCYTLTLYDYYYCRCAFLSVSVCPFVSNNFLKILKIREIFVFVLQCIQRENVYN